VPDIYTALSAVMGDVQSIGKDNVNTQQHYKFRGIDAVMDAVGPVLRKHKVIVVPNVRTFDYGEIATGKERKPMGHARVVVEYTFYAPDGSHIVSSAAGEAFDSGDKATPKAMSVAYRTALLQALCVPTGDPEPDADSYERSGYQEPVKPAWDPLKDAKNKAWQAAQAAGLDVDAMLAELRVWTGNPKLEAAEMLEVEMWAGFTAHLQSIDPTVEKPDKFDEAGYSTPEGAQT
jgi:hypothetical protein